MGLRFRRAVLSGAVVLGTGLCAACGSSTSTGIVTPPSTGFTPSGSEAPGSTPPGSGTVPAAAGGTTTSLGKPTLNEASTVSTVGLDKVHFGMTLAEAEQAAGTQLPVDGPKNPSCYLVKPVAGPEGVSFLVSDGRIERVDVGAGRIATRSGAKIGMTEAQVKQTYPNQIETQARPDGAPGNALVYVPKESADAKFRLVFLTDGTTVQSYRAGRLPQVLAATGCGT